MRSEPKDKRVGEKKAAFAKMTEKDPLGLNKLQKGQSESKHEQRKNTIYGLVCGIFLLMIISLMFFMIAHLEGATMGTEQQEVDAIIDKKLSDYIDHTPGAKNSSANKGSGAKAENQGDSLDSIQMALKLVPNMDQHNFLLKRMTIVGGGESSYTGMESSIDYDMEAIGEGTPRFYEWNGASNMAFPTMNIDSDHVPLGDSVGMCMGLSWIQMKKRNQFDKYMEIRNMPPCEEAKNGRSQWEDDYPTHGVDFHIWQQDIKKGDGNCNKGTYMASSDLCFTYKVMTQVCALVKFRHDPETNQYSWLYTGGCYKGNEPVHYEEASTGSTHTFKEVQFEVRFDNRPWEKITIIPEEAAMEEAAGDKDNATENAKEKEEHPEESKQEKLIRKKKESLQKEALVAREYKPKGMYLFHQFFIFISILSMFLAIVCVIFLIYYVVQMAKQPNEEADPLIK